MRKLLFLTLVLSLVLLCGHAVAETHVFDDLRATVEIPDSYVILTSENLAEYAPWLEGRGMSLETVSNDFLQRGVLVQCWTTDNDACFELTAAQTEQSKNIFDVNEQANSIRAGYRLGHYPDNLYTNEGYEFSSADWKNTPNGRFLILRYIKRANSEIDHRGLMRRTIRNGYQITFDMKVYGRSITNKDNANLNKIWDTFKFVEVLPLPPSASAKINITDAPPAETNEKDFTITGTAAEGVKLTAVVMGLSAPTPVVYDVEVGASGKFKMPIKLAKEGVFLITITGEYQGEDVVELAYPVTYQRTLLTVNITSPMPEVITYSDVVLLGTSEPGATIQVFLNGEPYVNKKVTAAGKFKIEVQAKNEGPYELVLVFGKKGLSDRRVTYAFTRKWAEGDMVKELKSQAIKPGYGTLTKKIKGYEGRVMGYKCYMISTTQSGDEWISQMALTKKGSDYSGIILVTSSEEPNVPSGGQIMMYGTCVGMSLPDENDETQTSYPCFELLLFASLE